MLKKIITEIDSNLLADIFETASFGNDMWGIDYDGDFYEQIPEDKRNQNKCFAYKMADVLLNGGKVYVYDLEAEGELYGNLTDKKIETFEGSLYDVEEAGLYTLSLQDVLDGINRHQEAIELLEDLDNCDGDVDTASSIIQYILFDELIYG